MSWHTVFNCFCSVSGVRSAHRVQAETELSSEHTPISPIWPFNCREERNCHCSLCCWGNPWHLLFVLLYLSFICFIALVRLNSTLWYYIISFLLTSVSFGFMLFFCFLECFLTNFKYGFLIKLWMKKSQR